MEYLEQIVTWGGTALAAVLGTVAAIIMVISKIKKGIAEIRAAAKNYDNAGDHLEETAEKVILAGSKLQDVINTYKTQKAELEQLRIENKALRQSNNDIKQALVLMASGMPSLVANGVAREVKELLDEETQAIAIDEVKHETADETQS